MLNYIKNNNKNKTKIYFNILKTNSSKKLPYNKQFKLQSNTNFHIITKNNNKTNISNIIFFIYNQQYKYP